MKAETSASDTPDVSTLTLPDEEILANLPAGVEMAGPLPPDLQNYTVYEAAVPSNAPSPAEAKAFFDLLVGQPARARFGAMGFEPVE